MRVKPPRPEGDPSKDNEPSDTCEIARNHKIRRLAVDLPPAFYALFLEFAPHFTAPTFRNLVTLVIGAVLAPKSRTVAACLRASPPACGAHFTTYHRALSRARWTMLDLARALAKLVVSSAPKSEPVYLVTDDTLTRHRGAKVYGKGRHRDPLLSTKSRHVSVYGHRWVVLCILLPMPFSKRPWALPIFCLLYSNPPKSAWCSRCKKHCAKRRHRNRHHRTVCDLARIMTRLVRDWIPDRRCVLVGDAEYGSHDLARSCRGSIALASRAPKKMALYKQPPPRRKGQRGRPRVKGDKLPTPLEAVANPEAIWETGTVRWYGESEIELSWTSGEGHWYRQGVGLVWVRWVWSQSKDKRGHLREECFFTTDRELSPRSLLELYADRWQIEVLFQESRAHLGLETTRCRSKNSVCRSFSGLLGLYSLVALWYRKAGWKSGQALVGEAPWYDKKVPSFRDALACLRKEIWASAIKSTRQKRGCVSKFTGSLHELLMYHLTAA